MNDEQLIRYKDAVEDLLRTTIQARDALSGEEKERAIDRIQEGHNRVNNVWREAHPTSPAPKPDHRRKVLW